MKVAGAWLVMTNFSPENWCAEVTTSERVIGRAEDADIRVPPHFADVSRHHAAILADDEGAVWIRDLKSRRGVAVNGLPLVGNRPTRLSFGDRLQLGSLELQLCDEVPSLSKIRAVLGLRCQEHDGGVETVDESRLQLYTAAQQLTRLSAAEIEILLWMCRGYSTNEELGAVLGRSPNTVRTQLGRVFQKLELNTRSDLLAWLQRIRQLSAQ